MGLSYKMFVNDGTLDIRLNVNNVFDNVYISELRSAIAAGEGTGVYYMMVSILLTKVTSD